MRSIGAIEHEKGREPRSLSGRFRGDPTRIRQILNNLLGNACKFTEKGAIELRISPAEDSLIRFSVAVDGTGIPAAKLLRTIAEVSPSAAGPAS